MYKFASKLQFSPANDSMPKTEPKASKLKCESLHFCRPLRTQVGWRSVMRMHVSESSVFPRRDIVCSVFERASPHLPRGADRISGRYPVTNDRVHPQVMGSGLRRSIH
ncbi:hypothetical protein CEXT_460301 [Caerostris extrusa]|uniref:Uncharacterized protein n=1 Tax=Caerostris extrusa TaxID=172846 RepID=A0AAV4Y4A3_CAEEX|nr:hypothetical protein CEXT_460301 [Caerostris extrusa]